MPKPFRFFALLVLLLAGPATAVATEDDGGEAYAREVAATLVGTRPPPMRVTTIDGQIIDLGALYGHKTVYLKFWATWCVPCREQMPHLERTFENAGPDTVVIAVNTNFNETPEGVAAFRKKFGLKMPIVMDDGRLAEAFHLRVTPQHVVIGRDGRIAYVGHLVSPALEAALAGGKGSVSPQAPERAQASAGDPAKTALTTLDGTSFDLGASANGQPSILVFTSPWCEGYLAQSQPEAGVQCRSAREQSDQLSAHSGVRWLGIASGLWSDADGLRSYRDKKHVTLPLALDVSGDVFRRYQVKRVPTVILLDADGREVQRLTSDMTELPALVKHAETLRAKATKSDGQNAADAHTEHVELSLESDVQTVQPGQALHLAVRQRIAPGWHTYWRNPGDGGKATQIAWSLPEGWKAGEIVWKAPSRYTLAGMVNFVYSDEVLLPAPVQVPASAHPGDSLTLRADVRLVVCKDVCIPERASLALPVVVGSVPGAASTSAADIGAALRDAPSAHRIEGTFQSFGDGRLRLTVSKPGIPANAEAFFFPYEEGVVDASGPQRRAVTPDTVTLTLPRAEASAVPGTLSGVVTLSNGEAFEVAAHPKSPK